VLYQRKLQSVPILNKIRYCTPLFLQVNLTVGGIPGRAEPSFEKTEPGDLVLIIPWIGIHGGGVHQLGIVKATCPVRALHASRILWPDTPYERLYPLLFFFETEEGNRPWYDFLADLGYNEKWNPHGWYRAIGDSRFLKWGGPQGYLKFLREQCDFRKK
jgi:hypothetical protein